MLDVPKKSREVAMAIGVAPDDMEKAARFFAREAAGGKNRASIDNIYPAILGNKPHPTQKRNN